MKLKKSMNTNRVETKIFFFVVKHTAKNLLTILFTSLFLITNIIFIIIIDQMFMRNYFSALSNIEFLIYIKIICETIFLLLSIIFITYNNFIKQKRNTIHSLEFRSGVKRAKTFYIRYGVTMLFLTTLVFAAYLLNLFIFSLLNFTPSTFFLGKLIFIYLFYFIFVIIFTNLLLCIIFVSPIFVSSFVSLITYIAFIMSPFLNSLKYNLNDSGLFYLSDMRNLVSTEEKLNYANLFAHFIANNSEYKFLISEWSGLNISYFDIGQINEWDYYQRVLYFGDVLSIDDYFDEKYSQLAPNMISMLNKIDHSLERNEWSENCSVDTIEFDFVNNRHNLRMKNTCDVSSFAKYLSKKNLVFNDISLNPLLDFIASTYRNFDFYNLANLKPFYGNNPSFGSVYKMGIYSNRQEMTPAVSEKYKTPIEQKLFWLLYNVVWHYMALDHIEVGALQNYNRLMKIQKQFNFANVFSQISTLYNGVEHNNLRNDTYKITNNLIPSFVTEEIDWKNNDYIDGLDQQNVLNDYGFNEHNGVIERIGYIGESSFMNWYGLFFTDLISMSIFVLGAYLLYKRTWN